MTKTSFDGCDVDEGLFSGFVDLMVERAQRERKKPTHNVGIGWGKALGINLIITRNIIVALWMFAQILCALHKAITSLVHI